MNAARAWRSAPAILAFTLLLVQMWLPWSVPHFVTPDGPSYLYNAVVAKELLLDSHSPYQSVYRFHPGIVPTWTATVVLGSIIAVIGPAQAEKVLMSLCLCVGFFSLHYAIRTVAKLTGAWTPLVNFLLQTWFLVLGFYNFYLGMMLAPLVIGYYIRHAGDLRRRDAAILTLGFVGLYLTHFIAAAFAMLAVGVIAVWMHLRPRPDWRHLGLVAGTMLPVLALFVRFWTHADEGIVFDPQILDAWQRFPMQTFTTADGFTGNQIHLWPVVLGLIVIAIVSMRRAEWRTVRGGLALATAAAFATYLLIPEHGLSGGFVKVRFVWGTFILGTLLICSVRRLLPLRPAIAAYAAFFLSANLVASFHAIRGYSAAVEDYLAALAAIPPGSNVVRLRYPTPDLPGRYGFDGIARDPLIHLDSYFAAQRRWIDWTDYQATNNVFPVTFQKSVDRGQQFSLLGFENPGDQGSESFQRVREGLPSPIDYVIVVAGDASPNAADRLKLVASLDSGMQLIARGGSPPFVRVYKRVASR